MTPPPDPASPPNATPLEPGPRCPECDYDLTGLTEHRCPECGKPFDPEHLRAILSGEPMPIPGWDDRRGSIVVAFVSICLQTWFRPTSFARRFPWCYRVHSVTRFWLLTHFTAMGVLIFQGIVTQILDPSDRGDYLRGYLSAAFGVFPGATVCEVVVVLLLKMGTRRREYVPPDQIEYGSASSSWWGIVAFFNSFLVLASVIVGTLGLASTQHRHLDEIMAIVVMSIAVLSAWWWLALVRGVLERTIPTAGRVVVCLLIPLAVIAGMIGGSIAAQVCLFGR